MNVKGGWKGTVSQIGDQSVLVDTAPHFPISEIDFVGDDGELMIYLYSGQPGLFNGDQMNISCQLTEEAHLFLTNPSATELHPSLMGVESTQLQTFKLEKDSILEYIPEPLIPFKGSNYKGKTILFLEEGSQAIIGDIFTAGRVGYGERYEYEQFASIVEIYWQENLVAWDAFKFKPTTERGMEMMRHYTHIGTLWILSEKITYEHLRYVQTEIMDCVNVDCYGGASLLQRNGIVIRLLGFSAQDLQETMKKCWDYFRVQLFHLQPLDVLK